MSFHERMLSWAFRAVPVTAKMRIRRFAGALTRSAERHGAHGLVHAVRLAGEKARYADQAAVHDLPPIFHYWSNTHLLPMLGNFNHWEPARAYHAVIANQSLHHVLEQDVLPLLVERFGFALFFGFANAIDPFVNRAFGPNFDARGAWDREFIDRVHQRDQAAILLGQITPTHMLAIMRRRDDRPTRIWKHLSPTFCLRKAVC